jgi:uroporphyrinogen-III synthase
MIMPLANRRVAVTRAAEQASDLAGHLEGLGARVLVCPLITAAPPDDPRPLIEAVQHLARYDWLVVPSANAARALLDAVADSALLAHARIAAVGPTTAGVLREGGLRVDLVPAVHSAAGLLYELRDLAGTCILLPQGDIARPELGAGLREQGARVDVVTAYRTVPGPGVASLVTALRAGDVDAITFASPSALRYLLDGCGAYDLAPGELLALLASVALVAIGPTTAAALRDAGLAVAAIAEPHTAEGLARAVVAVLGER